MTKRTDPRCLAALLIKDVMIHKQSLDKSLLAYQSALAANDLSLCKALAFGVLRHYESLNQQLQPLLKKPLRNKDFDVYALLLIGTYQLSAMRMPEYAAIDSVVKASKNLKKPWAANLVNAVLRKVQNSAPVVVDNEYPSWLAEAVKRAWPEQAQSIFQASQQEPPLCLRVNQAKISREHYLQQLEQHGFIAHAGQLSSAAVYIDNKPSDIFSLPGFADGLCSVQDEAAQMAAFLLAAKPHSRILDACAAPGGKTCHILEQVNNQAELLALDIDATRLLRVQENLSRLALTAQLQAGDVSQPDGWHANQRFDYILCDAPCSATGVIRRHPDIKYLRSAEDIQALAQRQLAILNQLWSRLNDNGFLLYATCSIMPSENQLVIEQFCQTHTDCQLETLPQAAANEIGWQLLPTLGQHDGFYYARLKKLGTA